MNVLEIFSCSGGMAEGFRRAGLPVSMAFDYDADACDSYEANHGHRPIRMDARDLLRMVEEGWTPGALDLLVADPPCTPWSRAGKRLGTSDERDMMGVTVELIRLLRPNAYLIGNVPGLDDSTNWAVVQEFIGGLSRCGYCVVDYFTLDAADYGVPQHRVRPFWFGHLDGDCLSPPAPTHASPEASARPTLPGMEALRPWVTVREALGHLSPEEMGTPIRLRWRDCNTPQHGSVAEKPARVVGTSNLSDGNVLIDGPTPRPTRRRNHRPSAGDEPAKTLTRNTHSDGALLVSQRADGSVRDHVEDEPAHTLTSAKRGQDNLLLTNRKHPVNTPDAPSFTVTTKGDGRGAQGACVLVVPDKIIEWPWDRPSTTITTREAVPPPGHHPESGSILTLPNAVKLSEKAAAILQGFPEGWTFSGKTKRARWGQIGMAMPPALAEAVARQIAAWFLKQARAA